MSQSTRLAKLQQLMNDEGFTNLDKFMNEVQLDSINTGICMNPGCDYITEVEPDCYNGWCEYCKTRSVMSASNLILVML